MSEGIALEIATSLSVSGDLPEALAQISKSFSDLANQTAVLSADLAQIGSAMDSTSTAFQNAATAATPLAGAIKTLSTDANAANNSTKLLADNFGRVSGAVQHVTDAIGQLRIGTDQLDTNVRSSASNMVGEWNAVTNAIRIAHAEASRPLLLTGPQRPLQLPAPALPPEPLRLTYDSPMRVSRSTDPTPPPNRPGYEVPGARPGVLQEPLTGSRGYGGMFGQSQGFTFGGLQAQPDHRPQLGGIPNWFNSFFPFMNRFGGAGSGGGSGGNAPPPGTGTGGIPLPHFGGSGGRTLGTIAQMTVAHMIVHTAEFQAMKRELSYENSLNNFLLDVNLTDRNSPRAQQVMGQERGLVNRLASTTSLSEQQLMRGLAESAPYLNLRGNDPESIGRGNRLFEASAQMVNVGTNLGFHGMSDPAAEMRAGVELTRAFAGDDPKKFDEANRAVNALMLTTRTSLSQLLTSNAAAIRPLIAMGVSPRSLAVDIAEQTQEGMGRRSGSNLTSIMRELELAPYHHSGERGSGITNLHQMLQIARVRNQPGFDPEVDNDELSSKLNVRGVWRARHLLTDDNKIDASLFAQGDPIGEMEARLAREYQNLSDPNSGSFAGVEGSEKLRTAQLQMQAENAAVFHTRMQGAVGSAYSPTFGENRAALLENFDAKYNLGATGINQFLQADPQTKLNQTTAAYENATRRLAESVLPLFASALDTVTEKLRGFTGWTERHPVMTEGLTIAGVIASFTGLGAAAVGLRAAIPGLLNLLRVAPAAATAATTGGAAVAGGAAIAGAGLLSKIPFLPQAAAGLAVHEGMSMADPNDRMGSWIDRNVPGASFIDNMFSHIGLGRSYDEQNQVQTAIDHPQMIAPLGDASVQFAPLINAGSALMDAANALIDAANALHPGQATPHSRAGSSNTNQSSQAIPTPGAPAGAPAAPITMNPPGGNPLSERGRATPAPSAVPPVPPPGMSIGPVTDATGSLNVRTGLPQLAYNGMGTASDVPTGILPEMPAVPEAAGGNATADAIQAGMDQARSGRTPAQTNQMLASNDPNSSGSVPQPEMKTLPAAEDQSRAKQRHYFAGDREVSREEYDRRAKQANAVTAQHMNAFNRGPLAGLSGGIQTPHVPTADELDAKLDAEAKQESGAGAIPTRTTDSVAPAIPAVPARSSDSPGIGSLTADELTEALRDAKQDPQDSIAQTIARESTSATGIPSSERGATTPPIPQSERHRGMGGNAEDAQLWYGNGSTHGRFHMQPSLVDGQHHIAMQPRPSHRALGVGAMQLPNPVGWGQNYRTRPSTDNSVDYGGVSASGDSYTGFGSAGSMGSGSARTGRAAPAVPSGPEVEGSLRGGAANATFAQRAPQVMAALMRDLHLTREQAAGIVGNLGHESGGFRVMQEINPQGGGRGGLGWAQWTGPRRVAYEQWAAEHHLSTSSAEANYRFLVHELQTTERNSLNLLRRETTVAGATQSFEQNNERAGVVNMTSRNRYAEQAAAAFSANPQVVQDAAQATPGTVSEPQATGSAIPVLAETGPAARAAAGHTDAGNVLGNAYRRGFFDIHGRATLQDGSRRPMDRDETAAIVGAAMDPNRSDYRVPVDNSYLRPQGELQSLRGTQAIPPADTLTPVEKVPGPQALLDPKSDAFARFGYAYPDNSTDVNATIHNHHYLDGEHIASNTVEHFIRNTDTANRGVSGFDPLMSPTQPGPVVTRA